MIFSPFDNLASSGRHSLHLASNNERGLPGRGDAQSSRGRDSGHSRPARVRHPVDTGHPPRHSWRPYRQDQPGNSQVASAPSNTCQAEQKVRGGLPGPGVHITCLEMSTHCPLSHWLPPSGPQGHGLANSLLACCPALRPARRSDTASVWVENGVAREGSFPRSGSEP